MVEGLGFNHLRQNEEINHIW